MRKISKGTEPISLGHYRSSIAIAGMKKPNIYEDFREKNILRKQLLEEQGYICCYCMGRIGEHNSKIEHFQSQSGFRKRQIDYANLFVSCKGGEGTKMQHCDTAKGNTLLVHIDLLRMINNEIKYFKNGRIQSAVSTETTVSDLTIEMKSVLKLNTDILIKNRKQTYNDFTNKLRGKCTRTNLQKAIDSYRDKQQGKYAPYSEMMVYLLSTKLKAI